MLILTRRPGEAIRIGDNIRLVVLQSAPGKVRLGIDGPLALRIPREELYARVDARIEAMFSNGFVEEVQTLLQRGYSSDLPTLSAIGYREVIQYLHGDCSLEDAKILMRRKTREFIRRQANWFKPEDPAIEWVSMTPDPLEQITRSVMVWYEGTEK